jgi:prepilin-type N-terminal cleavage/methylation domain-containing protein
MISRLNRSGFTLVELLVAMAISTIVLTLIYQVYRTQLRTHTTQQELVEMQQNLRAALYLTEREISIDDISFAMDVTGGTTLTPSDGDTNDVGEQIRYRIDGSGNLVRDASDGNGEQIILDGTDINFLTFVYKDEDGLTLDDDGNGNLTTTDSLRAIRSVEIILDANIGTTVMVDSRPR